MVLQQIRRLLSRPVGICLITGLKDNERQHYKLLPANEPAETRKTENHLRGAMIHRHDKHD